MIILSTAVFLHVTDKHGYRWEGAGVAWFIAAALDAIIAVTLIINVWGC